MTQKMIMHANIPCIVLREYDPSSYPGKIYKVLYKNIIKFLYKYDELDTFYYSISCGEIVPLMYGRVNQFKYTFYYNSDDNIVNNAYFLSFIGDRKCSGLSDSDLYTDIINHT